MLFKAPHLFLSFTPFSTIPTSLRWRADLQHRRLAADISSLLLHRKNWPSLLRANSSPFLRSPTSALIRHILHRTQTNPDTSLSFFQWSQSNLGFEPDLPSLCKMTHILIQSDHIPAAKKLLLPARTSHLALDVLNSMIRVVPSNQDSLSKALGFVLEFYSDFRRTDCGLETFRMVRSLGCQLPISSCNALLKALCSNDEIEKALCFFAAAIRSGVSPDVRSWSLLAQLLCKSGKIKNAALLLDLGLCGDDCYEMVIDCYSRRGDFGAAIGVLNKMFEKNMTPGFGVYSSILDGGCRFGDTAITEWILREMAEQGLLQAAAFLDYNWVISRLCELDKNYAADMFFQRARTKKIGLSKRSKACVLMALSREIRIDQAIRVYEIMLQEHETVDRNCYEALLTGICNAEPSCAADRLLNDVIAGGYFLPDAAVVSRYIAAQCSKGMWAEAGQLLGVAMEKGVIPEPHCYGKMVQHFCSTGMVDSALLLHDKMKTVGGCLDVDSYNSLLSKLLTERRIEEAMEVFDHMQQRNVLSSGSFVVMINALCCSRELRKAMKLHDEMLRMGLKPDHDTYRNLISGFR